LLRGRINIAGESLLSTDHDRPGGKNLPFPPGRRIILRVIRLFRGRVLTAVRNICFSHPVKLTKALRSAQIMKRSQINNQIVKSIGLLRQYHITLPAFAYWSLAEWNRHAAETDEIRSAMLGWDVTDYGTGRFEECGAVLFTVRNGVLAHPEIGSPYAEKYIILDEGQYLPCHCHKVKTEDIINRAGGVMRVRLWNSLPGGGPNMNGVVRVRSDGLVRTVAAGEPFDVLPGQSVRLVPGMYHVFGAKTGCGPLICGEVSSVNDDRTDNYFTESYPRFARIEEDEPPLHPLCNEYTRLVPCLKADDGRTKAYS